jgi:hypothetical protein
LSLHDEYKDIDFESGTVLMNCKLELPESGSGHVNLEVRNILPIDHDDPTAGNKIGCQFKNLGMSFGATIQRYINSIEAMRRRMES